MKSLVIFDFDGTLADTSPGIFNSIRHASQTLGLPAISERQMRSFIGPPLASAYESNFGLSGQTLERAMQLHKQYGVERGFRELKFYGGIFALLDELKDRGVKTAVATLKVQPTVDKIVKEFDCAKYFSLCRGADLAAPMTKAQMLQYCMESAGVCAEETVLVGDSRFDAEGAQQAGTDFIAVTYGFGFVRGGAIEQPHIAAADSVEELTALLLNMCTVRN